MSLVNDRAGSLEGADDRRCAVGSAALAAEALGGDEGEVVFLTW